MKNQTKGIFRIGTSGVAVPGSKETFPEEFQSKSRLNYYASLFNSLEVNSTFHKVPMASTFKKWAEDVPADFQFTVKLWREVTHVKQLKFEPGNLDISFNAANNIGDKKGCLLIQFPGKISMDYFSEVEQILERLHQLDTDNEWRKAIEFRNVSWYIAETNELLDYYDASLVLQDMPKAKTFDINKAAPFMYYRFHGPKGDYRGSYSDEFLQEHADKIRSWLQTGKDAYAYFNNTMGSAHEDAVKLRAMVEM